MKKHTLTSLFFLPLMAPLLADPIGINFGAGRPEASLDPAVEAGVIAQVNWNNASGGSGGPVTLNDATGTDSGATVAWATDEQWSDGTGAVDGNGILLNGWISVNNSNAPDATVTIANIPFAAYDLYVYYNHDRVTEDVDISEANSAFPLFRAQENDTDILAPVTLVQQIFTADGDDTQMGNYAKFTNLSAANLDIILAPAGAAGTTTRGAITGIQIVEFISGDSDGDGLADSWEQQFGLDFNDNGLDQNNAPIDGNPNGAAGDPDNDGSPNSEEETRGTSPIDEDTDNDTLLDGVETNDGNYIDATATGTNPLSNDSDGDTLPDNVENNSGTFVDETDTGTDPNLPDTDGDTLRDDWEIANLLDPFDDGTSDPDNGATGDPDTDGLDNSAEQTAGTDPQDGDSDDDNIADGVETNDGNYVDGTATGTNPLNPDSDGDGLQDDVEDNSGTFVSITQTGTDPNVPDTDGDSFKDGWEINNGRDALNINDHGNLGGALGLNFGAGRPNAALQATDIAGVIAQANWNNLELGVGGPTDLLDDTGVSSGASVSWNLSEQWSFAGPAADANGTLLTGWVSANGPGAPNTIDITSIPYQSYDLVVYMAHDRATDDVDISELNGAFPTFTAHEDNTDILNAVAFNQQSESATVAAQRGNFFVIPDLTAADLNLMLDPAGALGSADRGAITGIQLVNRGGAGGPVIISIEADPAAGEVTITWTSRNGQDYAVDAGPSPLLTDAQEIDDSQATGSISTFTETGVDFDANPKRFYRIRELSN